MKMLIAILLWTGLVPYLASGSDIKDKSKRFILTFSTCNDAIDNCADYGQSVCSDQTYAGWAKDNCKKTCNLCSDGGSSGSVPQPSTCTDKLSDCSAYGSSSCTGQYVQWATENCAKTCNLCSSRSLSSTGGSGGGIPVPGTGSSGGGSFSGSSSACSDKLSDCSAYGSSSCTGQYLQWATENCAKTCNLCPSTSMSGTGGSGGGVPVPGTGSSGGGSFSGSSSGCFYNSQIYQEGQTWNDGCKYKCRCTDGTSGKYECRQLCLNWDLPPSCTMNPPAPGKCCPTPSCPSNIILQYPQGYVDE